VWWGRYQRNRQLFVVIASVTPLTIAAQELIEHFRNRWKDEQTQTEQYRLLPGRTVCRGTNCILSRLGIPYMLWSRLLL
jgi:hypothetical protein